MSSDKPSHKQRQTLPVLANWSSEHLVYQYIALTWDYVIGFVRLLVSPSIHSWARSSLCQTTERLIKKVTTFSIVLHTLYSTKPIVIHEHFKELQKMNNLPPVPWNSIILFRFYVKMKTNVSKPTLENNRFSVLVFKGQILQKPL